MKEQDNQAALDRLAQANAHRPKLWMCPDCHVRVRVENAPNHADCCLALQRGAESVTERLEQSEDDAIVATLTAITRAADETFQRVGGSSRHWVRDCFLPELNRCGWKVDRFAPTARAIATSVGRESR